MSEHFFENNFVLHSSANFFPMIFLQFLKLTFASLTYFSHPNFRDLFGSNLLNFEIGSNSSRMYLSTTLFSIQLLSVHHIMFPARNLENCRMIRIAIIELTPFSRDPEFALGYSESICKQPYVAYDYSMCIVLYFRCKILMIDVLHEMVCADQILVRECCPRNRFQGIRIQTKWFQMRCKQSGNSKGL